MNGTSQRRFCLGAPTSLLAAAGFCAAAPAFAQTTTVPFYHNTADHAGLFTVTGLTAVTAGATKQDIAFNGAVSGVINAAPLYWRPAGATSGSVIVATENNDVYALDESTGVPVWHRNLGAPGTNIAGCGDIKPLGITGTPVIDQATDTLYVPAIIEGTNTPLHQLFALSLATGAVLPNYPVRIGDGIRALGKSFDDGVQEQRGALALLDGKVFIPFGGYNGDCGNYHGVVASVSTGSTPKVAGALITAALKGGVWAPGGVVSDGTSLFITTGNTTKADNYGGGEALVRATPDLAPIRSGANYFSPSNWKSLDNDDYDLGGVAPTLIDLPDSSPAQLALALGKDGNAYLLNRNKLGGIGTALQTLAVSGLYTHTNTARYASGTTTYVAFTATKPFCTGASQAIVALKINPGTPPNVQPAWCAPMVGRGDPIVTTSDGTADPIVWAAGAEGDSALHAYDGLTGAVLFNGPKIKGTIRHFSTLMVANHRLFVTTDNKVIAYTLAPGN